MSVLLVERHVVSALTAIQIQKVGIAATRPNILILLEFVLSGCIFRHAGLLLLASCVMVWG